MGLLDFLLGPTLPPLPALGPLPPAEADRHFRRHASAHAHLFPSETALAWEAVRGWDVNAEPATLDETPLTTVAILTDRLLHFGASRGGRWKCEFDFLLRMIVGVEHDGARAPAGAPPGTGLASIHTPSGCTLLVCSAGFATRLDEAVRAAKVWAREHGMQTAE